MSDAFSFQGLRVFEFLSMCEDWAVSGTPDGSGAKRARLDERLAGMDAVYAPLFSWSRKRSSGNMRRCFIALGPGKTRPVRICPAWARAAAPIWAWRTFLYRLFFRVVPAALRFEKNIFACRLLFAYARGFACPESASKRIQGHEEAA